MKERTRSNGQIFCSAVPTFLYTPAARQRSAPPLLRGVKPSHTGERGLGVRVKIQIFLLV